MRIHYHMVFMILLTVLILPNWGITHLNGQDTPLVQAGSDQILCEPGDIYLEGTVNSPVLSTIWMNGSGDTIATELATNTFADASSQYTLAVRYLADTNLVINGDFSQGDQDFTTELTYGTGTSLGVLGMEGEYGILPNTQDGNHRFANCNDHTGGGDMMVVNGLGMESKVWCQMIMIEPNGEYQFSAWVASAVRQNPADLRFFVNDEMIGEDYQAPSNVCDWKKLTSTWSAEATTSEVEICIVNTTQTAAGNDFAIDDIALTPIYTIIDTVDITVHLLNPSFSIPTDICRSQSEITLNSLLSDSATLGGIWDIDGQAVSDLTPSSLTMGDHILRYTVTVESCSEQMEQSFTIYDELSAGEFMGKLYICHAQEGSIRLTDHQLGADDGGTWTFLNTDAYLNAQLDSTEGVFEIMDISVGQYNVAYIQYNPPPCISDTAILALEVRAAPVADAGPDKNLSCLDNTALIGTPASGTDSHLSYQWSSPITTTVIENSDQPIATVSSAGEYSLMVIDTLTGCHEEDQVTVTSDHISLSATAETKPESCPGSSDGQIMISTVEGGTAPYMYQLDDQPFVMDSTLGGLSAGNYDLTIADVNGCDTTLTVDVEASVLPALRINRLDGQQGIVAAGVPVELEIITTADSASTIVWTPELDCMACRQVTVSPLSTTTYTATLTTKGGCTISNSITIEVDSRLRLYVPTAFSPNNDGVNDNFLPYAAKEIASIASMKVFDRWGGLLYSAENLDPNDHSTGWDGTSNGVEAPVGTYLYAIEIVTVGGNSIVKGGEINLLR